MSRSVTLWRASNDDYVDQGKSFATSKATAKAYLNNPGYGGASIYKTKIDQDRQASLDMTEWTWRDVRRTLDVDTPTGVGIDEWLPRDPKMLRKLGYLWAKVRESFPVGTTTWIWCGRYDEDPPELEVVP